MFSAVFLGACHVFYKLSAEGATHGGKDGYGYFGHRAPESALG